MTPTNSLLVSAIRNGTVIDHINAGNALKIVTILKLDAHKKIITIGLNLPSQAMNAKDLVKVEGRELTPEEVNQVALFAPQATVNIVRDYKIVKKFRVELPDTIAKIIVCPNAKCITNNEKMTTIFKIKQAKELQARCNYCEKIFGSEDIKSYNL